MVNSLQRRQLKNNNSLIVRRTRPFEIHLIIEQSKTFIKFPRGKYKKLAEFLQHAKGSPFIFIQRERESIYIIDICIIQGVLNGHRNSMEKEFIYFFPTAVCRTRSQSRQLLRARRHAPSRPQKEEKCIKEHKTKTWPALPSRIPHV